MNEHDHSYKSLELKEFLPATAVGNLLMSNMKPRYTAYHWPTSITLHRCYACLKICMHLVLHEATLTLLEENT
jgi:hypothetical protein